MPELVVLDDQGHSVWERLKKRHAQRSPDGIRLAAAADPAVLFVFDLLWLNGADLRPRGLLQRKAALSGLLPGNRRIRYAIHFADDPAELWEFVKTMKLEGIMAKDATAPYTAGRSKAWLKIKTKAGAERQRQRRPR